MSESFLCSLLDALLIFMLHQASTGQQCLIVVAVGVGLAAVPNDQHRNVYGKFGFMRMVVKTVTFYIVQHCAMWLWMQLREVCIKIMHEAQHHIDGSDIGQLISIVDILLGVIAGLFVAMAIDMPEQVFVSV